MASGDNDADALARKLFVMTMIGTVAYIAAVVIFVL